MEIVDREVSLKPFPINWLRMGEALEFYKDHGFKYIETPWITLNSINHITYEGLDAIRLVDEDFYQVNRKPAFGLVGSAEQGFLQLRVHQNLPDGWYVSTGPCFRDEAVLDKYHQKQFLKTELIRFGKEEEMNSSLDTIMSFANSFMSRFGKVDIDCFGDAQFDLSINNIEVGSYGIRYHKKAGWWVYGTGLAEPRFTLALEK